MIVHTDWLLTAQRVAIHVPTATAVVADLHLDYGECRRRAGEAIPFIDISEQLQPLGKAITKHAVRRLVIAGDLFEAGFCPEVAREFRQWLAAAGVKLTAIVPGNHDRDLNLWTEIGPIASGGFMLDRWCILHGNEKIFHGTVVHGHFHPCVRWHGKKLPCYLIGQNRIVLPAFSLDAAGVNVNNDPAWEGYHFIAIQSGKLLAGVGVKGQLSNVKCNIKHLISNI